MTWRVGQKALCVVGSWSWRVLSLRELWLDFWRGVGNPVRGRVYVVVAGHADRRGRAYLTFAEFPGWAFSATGFRPVVEREADISVFTAILDGVNRRAPAPAE